jgi:hypothetical protein
VRESDVNRTRLAGILLIAIAAIGAVALLFVGPMPQDQAYHEFADRRPALDIPNVMDVLSNVPFTIVGVIGLLWVLKSAHAFRSAAERRAALVFFVSVAFVGPGSGWYHLEPNNDTLLWDRVPIAAAAMALFAVLLAERFGPRIGGRLLAPLVLLGLASALYWGITDDLRPYGFAQFFPIAGIILLVSLTRAPYSNGYGYLVTIGFYALAKVAESTDRAVFDATGQVSGHTLKHLFAAAGAWWILRMMRRRSAIG